MYLIYVDESGDIGLRNSPSQYFVLSGLVVHELRWHSTLDAIIACRRNLRATYGLKLREEIHAADFLHHPGDLSRINKWKRVQLMRDVLQFEAGLHDVSVINVLVDKGNKAATDDVFEIAWRALVQRFHNTISRKNFPGPQNPQDFGILIADRTDEVKLRSLLRRMRRYNPVPSQFGSGYRQVLLDTMVEDPVHRDSGHSYFIQLADVNAYFLYQRESPCGYIKRKGGVHYFEKLEPVLCKVAAPRDPFGVVRL